MMPLGAHLIPLSAILICGCASAQQAGDDGNEAQTAQGWLDWRGPEQSGVSLETDTFETLELDGTNHLWSYDLAGRGTPVVAEGRVYTLGYEGEGPDLQEMLVCLDERTGKLIWERRWNDFLSDVIYDRYSVASPTIDPETGNIYVITTPGVIKCFSPDGDLLWNISSMATLGRLSFPNGRTGSPVIDGERLIVHLITAHWGPTYGPARDRFYAFDKLTGELIWGTTPGTGPKDSPYSHPVLGEANGRRVLYCGTGCGNVVCIDARTGDTLWRYRVATGGVNSSTVLYGNSLIAIHGRENMDTSTIGRMLSIKTGAQPAPGETGHVELDQSSEIWRNDLVAFTSSLVLVGDRVYVTDQTGELCCVNVETGEVLWREKLAPDQIHASPLYADGKLYVPMNNGTFHIVEPSDEGLARLASVQLQGNCLGAPALCNGRMYVHTTEKLYCFGSEGRPAPRQAVASDGGEVGEPVRLQVIPADVLMVEGTEHEFRVRALDANGRVVSEDVVATPAAMPLLEGEAGQVPLTMVAGAPGVGVLKVSSGDLSGTARVRVVKDLPWTEDFEGMTLNKKSADDGVPAAFPPSAWIGTFKKWEVVEHEGGNVLRKTLNIPLFQRSTGLVGAPEMSNYTMLVDIKTDGNRRILCEAGVINQRYLIRLRGNFRTLEISSNEERVKAEAPFRMKPGTWYRLKSRVDVAPDGSGVVRAKAWPRDEPEPEAWTLEAPHKNAHRQGTPGLFGLSPQVRFHAYLDNLSVTPND